MLRAKEDQESDKRCGRCGLPFFLLWYLFWGVCHETFHLIAAAIVVGSPELDLRFILGFFIKASVGRCCFIPSEEWSDVIRHVGWVTSVAAALCCFAGRKLLPVGMVNAAGVTALEALSTDLLGLGRVRGAHPLALFCGNFGVILLKSDWISDQGRTALDLLQEMIRITMMRGAQTGGVVAWTTAKSGQIQGIRARVVNRKRSDLSILLRRQVEKNILTPATKGLKPGIRALLGHTRFATSSKATLDGTHPHQWTPPRNIRVFDLQVDPPEARFRRVETFISHNGDLDFYEVGSINASLQDLQDWLPHATGAPMPAPVDSAAIAGLMDLLRTSGSLPLSLRFALLLDSPSSEVGPEPSVPVPQWKEFERVGSILEASLLAFCKDNQVSLLQIRSNDNLRAELAIRIKQDSCAEILKSSLAEHITDGRLEEAHGMSLLKLMRSTVNAFFDNDLFEACRVFIRKAKGSFGLMVTCSLDAQTKICVAAKGQPMSVAFYPLKGIVTFGSEQAAVKAGLSFSSPAGDIHPEEGTDVIDRESYRLDLNDLNGEVCLLDWGKASDPVERDRRCLVYQLMGGNIQVTLWQPRTISNKILFHRLTPLEDTNLIQPIPIGNLSDPVLQDLKDMPRVCRAIQKSWREPSLNRLTAWNLAVRLRQRLRDRENGKIPSKGSTCDILLTGCEVSLWVAEQFASDLQKAFPDLFVQSISSNKLLGAFGQELPTPAIGHSVSKDTPDLQDTIVIIVSHSGGTFAPLACSNLLQSVTSSIFVVTSEWDTQISKQVRSIFDEQDPFVSRIFTTEAGIRPAEPCSLSVVATHQFLTNLFEHICVTLSDPYFRRLSGSIITGADLRILERCNRDNISALEQIVGNTGKGVSIASRTELELRGIGKRWSRHVLENAKAHVMAFLYIVGTVTSGFPLVTGLSIASGLQESSSWFYLSRFVDSLIYFFLPQICITILRLFERRNLLHRMVARTVVIGDCPWVSQSAEAFLSKLFGRSYSIAGLNVISGNPVDHLVHRHTHRVVRGTLVVCGRQDGRLSALNSAELAVVLSMNQATSIQSLGSTCETVSIGHNPFETSLSAKDIFLDDYRPRFLCEQLLEESLSASEANRHSLRENLLEDSVAESGKQRRSTNRWSLLSGLLHSSGRESSRSTADFSQRSSVSLGQDHSPHAVKGVYMALKKVSRAVSLDSRSTTLTLNQNQKEGRERASVTSIVVDMTQQNHELAYLRHLFREGDKDDDGRITPEDFVAIYSSVKKRKRKEQILRIFHEIDAENRGTLGFEDFVQVARMAEVEVERNFDHATRDERGILQVEPSTESYFGERLRSISGSLKEAYLLSGRQHFSMELYESRVASMQRFVAMCVMFHELGSDVEGFFRTFSFGLLGYQMDRTQSILRIATTACPVSGAEVRERMERLRLTKKVRNAIRVISAAWSSYQQKRINELKVATRRSSDETSGISQNASSPDQSLGKSFHGPSKDTDIVRRPLEDATRRSSEEGKGFLQTTPSPGHSQRKSFRRPSEDTDLVRRPLKDASMRSSEQSAASHQSAPSPGYSERKPFRRPSEDTDIVRQPQLPIHSNETETGSSSERRQRLVSFRPPSRRFSRGEK